MVQYFNLSKEIDVCLTLKIVFCASDSDQGPVTILKPLVFIRSKPSKSRVGIS